MQTNFFLSSPRNFFTYSSFFFLFQFLINHNKKKEMSYSNPIFDSFIFFNISISGYSNHIVLFSFFLSQKSLWTRRIMNNSMSLRIEKYSPRVGSLPKESREAIREICKFQVTPLLLRRPEDPGCAPWKGEQPRVCTDLMMPRWCSLKFHFDVPGSRAEKERENKGCPPIIIRRIGEFRRNLLSNFPFFRSTRSREIYSIIDAGNFRRFSKKYRWRIYDRGEEQL